MKQRYGFLKTLLSLSCLLLPACSSSYSSRSSDTSDTVVQDLRAEIDELRHLVNASQVEINLLEEKLDSRDHSIDSLIGENSNLIKTKEKSLAEKFERMQKKLASVEQNQEKLATDLKKVSSTFNQSAEFMKSQTEALHKCEQDISMFKSKLDDLSAISSTLRSLSSTISNPPPSTSSSTKHYRVQFGDTLEKIAKKHQVSVQALKRANNLSTDTIYVGKELVIPTLD